MPKCLPKAYIFGRLSNRSFSNVFHRPKSVTPILLINRALNISSPRNISCVLQNGTLLASQKPVISIIHLSSKSIISEELIARKSGPTVQESEEKADKPSDKPSKKYFGFTFKQWGIAILCVYFTICGTVFVYLQGKK